MWIDYQQLRKCEAAMQAECPKFKAFFRPCFVLSLWRNERGLVSINQLFDLVMRQVSNWQTRLGLCSYDSEGDGYLTENDLESYIFDQIQGMPQLSKLEQHFYVTYVLYASRKFFFFLDDMRIGKIKVQKLLLSDIMGEFNELHEEDLHPNYEQSNWFSVPFVTRIHRIYIELDEDNNGLLSRQEFKRFDDGSLTEQFVKRMFQVYTTYNGEIDYKQYLDFVLAKEGPKRKQSIQFFFRILDIDHTGVLTPFSLAYFFRGIMEHPMMTDHDTDGISTEIICCEILDMVRPEEYGRVTLKDLLRSGKGHTVCSMLTDVTGFLAYEHREGPEDDSSDSDTPSRHQSS